jgi:flagellar transcriptional activator FlhD
MDSSHSAALMFRDDALLHNPFHVETEDNANPPLSQIQGAHNMTADQVLTEIREANLSYLMLAQSLIRADKEQALFRLGVSEESAAMIALLTPAQMMKIASGNTLLCKFRMDDELVWGLLTNHGKGAANETTSRLHASILMAGRHQEAA